MFTKKFQKYSCLDVVTNNVFYLQNVGFISLFKCSIYLQL